MRQYDIWWARLPPPAGRRLVLMLSRTSAYSYLHKVTVAEVTTTIRGIPVEVPLGPEDGLSVACVANLDNIRTIPMSGLDRRIGGLAAHRWWLVKRALGYAFEWNELLR